MYIGYLETVQINSQTIIHIVNIWSKEVPVNIIYPSIVNKIGGYLYARFSTSSVICIIKSQERKIQHKKR